MPTSFKTKLVRQMPTSAMIGIPAEEDVCLTFRLVKDLIAGGFNVYAIDDDTSTAGTALNAIAQTTTWTRITLIPTEAVDPLIDEQPWMVRLEVKGTGLTWTKNAQGDNIETLLQNTGLYLKVGSFNRLSGDNIAGNSLREYALVPPRFGAFGSDQVPLLGSYARVDFSRISPGVEMTYRLTVAERGFAFSAWPSVLTEDTRMAGIICIQRGVKCDGSINESATKPLYMITNAAPTNVNVSPNEEYANPLKNQWYYSIVLADGLDLPYPYWGNNTSNIGSPNGSNYVDNIISDIREFGGTSLNYFPVRWATPVTNDLGDYILVFPFGLTSDRFSYSDEIDLIAISKADAYQSGQEVPIEVFGEARTYTAMSSNNQRISYNAGIRVFMLTAAPGI